jgi:hypothetical protein
MKKFIGSVSPIVLSESNNNKEAQLQARQKSNQSAASQTGFAEFRHKSMRAGPLVCCNSAGFTMAHLF